jgi:hypothetical protein
MPLTSYGPYIVRGKHTPAPGKPGDRGGPDEDDTQETYRSFATLAWPFPDEHLVGAPDLTAIESLAGATGGLKNPTPAQLFDVGDAETESHVPLWPEPLPWALAFLVGDVLLRRVRLFGRTELRWL